ncbi:MAG: DEAD/DEAH box helicase family protein, partial [Desulfobacterota bacterium]|nr:DEAD/DEAH box helicase family protein [Thermodesulfobacteriota bacterium]
MQEHPIAEVIIPLPLDKSLDYLIPPDFRPNIEIGMPVLVPLEKRKVTGYIIGLKDHSSIEKLKSIEKVLDHYPLFGATDLSFFRWIANYYFSPLGEVIKCALPHSTDNKTVKPRREKIVRINEDRLKQFSFSELKQLLRKTPRQFEILKLLRKQGEMIQKRIVSLTRASSGVLKSLEAKGLIQSFSKEVYRIPYSVEDKESYPPIRLTPEQSRAVKKIISKIKEKKFAPFLLHGITGSGKTEVYLKAIQSVLAAGQTALVLVPEIALTPQLIARFKARFGPKIAQLHSRLSAGERFDEWRRILKGEAAIVIGTRSAIFAPLKS